MGLDFRVIRGLRFDKVAVRFVSGLQSALREDVPRGKTVLLAVTAPIRIPKQTASVLEERVRCWLRRSPESAELHDIINGNQIQVRLVNGSATTLSTVLAFVHNPGIDVDALFDAAQSDVTV
jgi:hypothetical protein